MNAVITSFGAGLLFSLGLGISGMTQADKVIDFLNVAGSWDPSLGLVMVGAIATHLVLYRLILRRASPLYGVRFAIPTRRDITPRLIGGSALFGIGWALGGYCPGPGLVSVASGSSQALTFVGALIGGMVLFKVVNAAMTHQRSADRRAA